MLEVLVRVFIALLLYWNELFEIGSKIQLVTDSKLSRSCLRLQARYSL